jgi:hypothetical protein
VVVGPRDLDTLRAELHARIRAAAHARQEARTKPKTCDHSWTPFRQTVNVENARFHGSAHFVVRGCTRCHAKELLDYRVGGDR